MLKRYWKKGLGLVLLTAASMLVGGFVLAGLGSHSAFAQLGASTPVAAAPVSITATVATPALSAATTPDTLRDRIIDMMKDHMGLTDQLASDWATEMVEHMEAVHGDQAGTMIDQMDAFHDEYFKDGQYGTMMGGVDSVGTGTMMGGTTTTTAASGGISTAPTSATQGSVTSPGAQGPSTMMGGSQVTSVTPTPVTPGTPGTMMNTTTGATSQGTTLGMMGGGGMGSRR